MSRLKKTMQNFEAYLNELEIDGRKNYGTWLRRSDPIAFRVSYADWCDSFR